MLIAALIGSLALRVRAEATPVQAVSVGYFFVNTPAMGDLDGDGQPDIVVTASGASLQPFAMATTGIVTALDGEGHILPGWPVVTNEPTGLLPPTAAVVGDLNGDGRAEVILGHGRSLYVFGGNGRLLWQRRIEGYFRKKPELCDLDGDGRVEIIAPADQFLGQARVYIWRSDGQAYPGSPIMLNEFFASSPAVYQNAGSTLLAVGGGNGYTGSGGSLYLFTLKQEKFQLRWQKDIGQHPISKPIFADLDGDGVIDILGGTYTPSVYAVRSTDGRFLQGWPQLVHGSVFTSPLVLRNKGQIMVLAIALDGTFYAWNSQGQSLWTVEINPSPNAVDQLTLADLNSDGHLEVLLGVNGAIVARRIEDGGFFGYWYLGNYWVTSTVIPKRQPNGNLRLILGGVDNNTEEAKLFIVQL